MNKVSKKVLDVDLSKDAFDIAVDLVEQIVSPLLIAKDKKSGTDESLRLYRSLIYSLYMLHYTAVGEIAGDEIREIIETAEMHVARHEAIEQIETVNEVMTEVYS